MDATSKPGAKKRKTWRWARATGSAGRNQQRRGGRGGSFGGKTIKERMGKRWGGNRQRRERKREAQPRSRNGRVVSHLPMGMQNLLEVRKPGFWSWL